MPDERELDYLLDSALRSYAEPDAHLNTRILAHISARANEPATTRRRWLPWAIALPVAACAILLAVLFARSARQPAVQQARHESETPAQAAQQSLQPQPPAISKYPPKLRPGTLRAARTATPKNALQPKLDVFPTPQPLTPEEQALVQFVTTAPTAERNAVLIAQQQRNEPLHIAEITIQPLSSLDKPETAPNQ